MHTSLRLIPLLLLPLLPACTRVKGVVEQASGRPMTSAIFSVGRPDGIAVYATHHVDYKGRFDFKLAPTDDTNLYIYDGSADPRLTLRRIDNNEINEHMVIQLQPANPNLDLNPTVP